jgi:hypothetical protein
MNTFDKICEHEHCNCLTEEKSSSETAFKMELLNFGKNALKLVNKCTSSINHYLNLFRDFVSKEHYNVRTGFVLPIKAHVLTDTEKMEIGPIHKNNL